MAPGRAVDASAYDSFTGRWSRLFVPSVLSSAEVAPGSRVLDVSTGTGEAALMALRTVGASGFVVGADISPAMLDGARVRLNEPLSLTARGCRSETPASIVSYVSLVCSSLRIRRSGWRSFGGSFAAEAALQSVSSLPRTRHRCGVF